MNDETPATDPAAVIAPEAPVTEPVNVAPKAPPAKAKVTPKLAPNQTMFPSGNVYTAH